MLRMQGAIQNSTSVMTAMNSLIKVPEIQANMMKMAKEMEKSGMINEIMNETIDDALGTDQTEVDKEVENVLYELTEGVLGLAPEVANNALPQSTTVAANIEIDEDDLEARMAALK